MIITTTPSIEGKTIEEYKKSKRDIGEAIMLDWLEYCLKQKSD